MKNQLLEIFFHLHLEKRRVNGNVAVSVNVPYLKIWCIQGREFCFVSILEATNHRMQVLLPEDAVARERIGAKSEWLLQRIWREHWNRMGIWKNWGGGCWRHLWRTVRKVWKRVMCVWERASSPQPMRSSPCMAQYVFVTISIVCKTLLHQNSLFTEQAGHMGVVWLLLQNLRNQRNIYGRRRFCIHVRTLSLVINY